MTQELINNRIFILISNVVLAALLVLFMMRSTPDYDGAYYLYDAMMLPDTSDIAQEVRLPLAWDRTSTSPEHRAEYSFTFNLEEKPGDLWALYLPRHRFSADFAINGIMIGVSGKTTHPVSRQHFTPYHYPIPTSLLKEGENTLTINLYSSLKGLAFLSAPIIGPNEILQPAYRTDYLQAVTLKRAILILTLLIGSSLAVLYFTKTSEPAYGYLSAICFLWSINIANGQIAIPPFPLFIWERVTFFSVFLVGVFYLVFALSYFKNLSSIWQKRLLIMGMLILIPFCFMPFQMMMDLCAIILLPTTSIMCLIGYAIIVLSAWGHGGLTRLAFSYAGLISLFTSGHDLLIVNGVLNQRFDFYQEYGALSFLALLGAVLINDLITRVREVDTLNDSLEERLKEKENALAQSYQTAHKMETRHAALKAREWMMRDLHDGLGARLVTLVRLAERETPHKSLASSAQDALQELRFVSAPLRSETPDISALLGLFREERLRPLENNTDMAVTWRVDEIVTPGNFRIAAAGHFLKVLDEALSNALRHGSGAALSVSLTTEPNGPTLTIKNPVTSEMPPSNVDSPMGAGVKNMKSRADLAGAILTTKTEDNFFCIEMVWKNDFEKDGSFE